MIFYGLIRFFSLLFLCFGYCFSRCFDVVYKWKLGIFFNSFSDFSIFMVIFSFFFYIGIFFMVVFSFFFSIYMFVSVVFEFFFCIMILVYLFKLLVFYVINEFLMLYLYVN